MRVVLITTCDAGEPGRAPLLRRLLDSVERMRAARPDWEVRHALLIQRAGADPALGGPDALRVEGRLSLSAARNRLLAALAAEGAIGPDTLVAFPDDDCWYPAGVLEGITEAFAADPQLDLWFCHYGERPEPLNRATEVAPAIAEVMRRASSNTIFLRGRLVALLPGFDEALGAGARWNGAEDNDYALAAFRLSRRVKLLDRPCIGHRDHRPELRARYWPGGLITVARHAAGGPGLGREFARKLLVGAALTARRELPPRLFVGAVGAAVRGWRTARRARSGG